MSVRIPRLASTVQRRLLINYRVDPAVAQTLIPDTLRPQIVDGSAVAGICLIRLGDLRPAFVRPQVGWGAENAAHRIAVEWDSPLGRRSGVYIPKRHSASRLAVVAGGRIFPGTHTLAHITSIETDDTVAVSLDAPDARVRAEVAVRPLLTSSLFSSLEEASSFFRKDAVGWSPDRHGRLEGLRLDTDSWFVDAADPIHVESSLFDGLPIGSVQLDHALLMRNVPVLWSTPERLHDRRHLHDTVPT